MIILVLNCGSSSLKYQLLDMKSNDEFTLKAKGIVERIGAENGVLKHQVIGAEDRFVLEKAYANHTEAVQAVLEALTDGSHGVMKSLDELDAVGHRVLHGGAKVFESQLVTPEVEAVIDECSDLGPLHNPANLRGIRAVKEVLPTIPQVAVFDTAFHHSMPAKAYMYALPYEYYEKYGIRRYGFHGTSHRYISEEAIKFGGLDPRNSKLITCHLGNGSSVSAVLNGKCYDTSMGLTPLEGIMMGTRCGTIDPEVVTYIMKKEGKTPDEMSVLMNKKSGFIGVSQVSSDMRDTRIAARGGNERSQLVLDMFIHQLSKLIGGYAAAMNGVDMIAVTGGIGENNIDLVAQIMDGLSFLGIKVTDEARKAFRLGDKPMMITAPDSKVKVAVMSTNEELVIARDTMNIVKANR